MRDYSKVSPRFWTGPTGKRIRSLGLEAQVVAFYLLTCPSANMIGLYYLPLPTLAHETGIPLEGACKALRSLSEAQFSHYDEAEEVVWVPEMARYQIEDELKASDNRCKGIWKEAEPFQKSRFFMDFWMRYEKAFHLPTPSPLEAPPKPLGSQEQEQEQEQEEEGRVRPSIAPPPPSASAESSPEKLTKAKRLKTTELKADSVEAFQAAWELVPKAATQWDPKQRREVEVAVAKGSRAQAERRFQAIVDAGLAGPRTLYVAFYAYLTEGDGPKKGFIQQVATFFGTEKATWREWLDRGRELEVERYGAVS